MPLVNVHCVNKRILKIPGLVEHVESIVQWMADSLNINNRQRVHVTLSAGRARGRTNGTAIWPYKCLDGQYEMNINVGTILRKSLTAPIDELTDAWVTHMRKLMQTVAHEMIHIKQYNDNRLGAEYRIDGYGRKVYYRTWMGEEWTGAKGATFKSYRHLPWEVEAFDNQQRWMEGYFRRENLITSESAREYAMKKVQKIMPSRCAVPFNPGSLGQFKINRLRTIEMKFLVNHAEDVAVAFNPNTITSKELSMKINAQGGSFLGRFSTQALLDGTRTNVNGYEIADGISDINIASPSALDESIAAAIEEADMGDYIDCSIPDDKADLEADRKAIIEEATPVVEPEPEVKDTPEPKKPAKRGSKAEKAKAIFDEMFGKAKPAEIKARFESEAEMSKAGASTYYYKFKKQAEA